MEVSDTESEIYEIEKLIDRRKKGRTYEYLIRWKGYDSDEDQWVKEKDIHAKDLVRDYNKHTPKTPSLRSRNKTKEIVPASNYEVSTRPFRRTQEIVVEPDHEEISTRPLRKTQDLAVVSEDEFEEVIITKSGNRSTGTGPQHVQARRRITSHHTDYVTRNVKDVTAFSTISSRGYLKGSGDAVEDLKQNDPDSSSHSSSSDSDQPDTWLGGSQLSTQETQSSFNIRDASQLNSFVMNDQSSLNASQLGSSASRFEHASFEDSRAEPPRKKEKSLIKLTVYDIPILVFLCIFLFLAMCMLVEKKM